jgi:hypothetical protein
MREVLARNLVSGDVVLGTKLHGHFAEGPQTVDSTKKNADGTYTLTNTAGVLAGDVMGCSAIPGDLVYLVG